MVPDYTASSTFKSVDGCRRDTGIRMCQYVPDTPVMRNKRLCRLVNRVGGMVMAASEFGGHNALASRSNSRVRNILDFPQQCSGRIDINGFLFVSVSSNVAGYRHDGAGLRRFHEVFLKACDILLVFKRDLEGNIRAGVEDDLFAHNFSPNCLTRVPDARDTTNFKKRWVIPTLFDAQYCSARKRKSGDFSAFATESVKDEVSSTSTSPESKDDE